MRNAGLHIFFCLLIATAILFSLAGLLPIWLGLIGGVIYFAILAWGSADIRSSLFVPVLWKPSSPEFITITFDDGPHPEHTPAILDILKAEGIQATFFCIGRSAEKHPAIVKRILSEGHEIGNHTFSHPFAWGFLPVKVVEKEIERTHLALRRHMDTVPRYFRPPFGVTMPALGTALKNSSLQTVGWSLRSLDTILSEEKTKARVLRLLKPGKLLLFHDTVPHTPAVLEETIRACKDRGIKIVSLQRFLSQP